MSRRAEASPEATPTAWARVWTACRARSSRLPPPALSATTSKRCGAPSTTSIACVPMEPVDPRRTILRGCMIQVSRTAFCARRCRVSPRAGGSPPLVDAAGRRRNVENVEWTAWFDAPEYEFARQVLQRGIATLYLVAFLSSLQPVPGPARRARPAAGAGVPRRLQPPGPAQPVPLALLGPAAADGVLERHGALPPRWSPGCRSSGRRGFRCSRSWRCGCCTCRS